MRVLVVFACFAVSVPVFGQCGGGQCGGGQGWGDATAYRVPQQPAPILYPTPVRRFLFGSHVGVPASTSIPTCPACGSPNCICGPDCKCQPGFECKNGKCIPKQQVEFKLSLVVTRWATPTHEELEHEKARHQVIEALTPEQRRVLDRAGVKPPMTPEERRVESCLL